jgi:hypothetical protein
MSVWSYKKNSCSTAQLQAKQGTSFNNKYSEIKIEPRKWGYEL